MFTSSEMNWEKITVTTSTEASEAVASCLFELNATGVELQESDPSTVKIIAYYPLDDQADKRMERIHDLLSELPGWGIQASPAIVDLTTIKSENWEEAWRASFLPRRVGKRILITPTWGNVPQNKTDAVIQLDPGMAFGTGQHPTTRLSLELLEGSIETHASVADIGTGSGILSIAAVKLGAKQVDAIELDPTAIPVAAANFETNGVTQRVHLFRCDGLKGVERKYDLIIGNILTEVILPIIPTCASRLYHAGCVIFSGILDTELAKVESILDANQFRCLEVVQETENSITWVGIKAVLQSAPAHRHHV